jgi:anthranilate phosphoribosyltransferase
VTIQHAIAATVAGRSLTELEMVGIVEQMMDGRVTGAQIGGLLVALRMKGESVDELCGAARALRRHAVGVRAPDGIVMDTCGTGGDARGTFNISTTAALIVAGVGVRVAKHGNRAMSGTTGAADVFEALGVTLDASPEALAGCLADVGIAFLFAPRLHPAMARVAGPRRELGVRTIFNLVGPLANPAGVRHQVVGVYGREWVVPLAHALRRLGAARALVVHGRDGLDELTLTTETDVAELDEGQVREYTLMPEDFGFTRCPLGALQVAGVAEAAAAVRGVLAGERGPRREVAVANAAAALYVAGRCESPLDGVGLAAEALDSGRAEAVLGRLVEWSTRHRRDA